LKELLIKVEGQVRGKMKVSKRHDLYWILLRPDILTHVTIKSSVIDKLHKHSMNVTNNITFSHIKVMLCQY
jgi:hypothetical protein